MHIEENKSLKAYNTFGIDSKARHFMSVNSKEELRNVLISETRKPLFILGGGSNILLSRDIDALVLHINMKGIRILSKNDQEVIVEAKAGENWHEFVRYCLANDFGGVENLALIPGNVGTAPIQNIGAYGVELNDVFEGCTALKIDTFEEVHFRKEDCLFGYRDSIFKHREKNKYIITEVQFRLTSKNHMLHTSYGDIQGVLDKKGIANASINDIAQAVIDIRSSKLPDPKVLGNSGSFFKNPIIDANEFLKFRSRFPEAPFYEVSRTEFKIPAGWLIENAGFKGQRFGDAGVHKLQALVLVNYGQASGQEIWELALRIQEKVKALFGILIEPEVNVY